MGLGSVTRVAWLAVVALALAVMPPEALGETRARVLDTEAWIVDNATVVVRGAYEVTGEPQAWVGFYTRLLLDANTALQVRDSGGQPHALVKHWGNVALPSPSEEPSSWAWMGAKPPVPWGDAAARWTGCRVGIPVAELEAAVNLPRGQRTVVWAVCDVYDCATEKYIAAGWPVRTPLFLTSDKAGKITSVEFAYAHPFVLRRNRVGLQLTGRALQLKLSHLKPNAGLQAYRAIGVKHDPYTILVLEDQQNYLWTSDRGFFFEAIDTPEKAVELFLLAHGDAVVVKTRAQFDDIVRVLTPLAKRPEPPAKTVPPGGMGLTPGPLPCEGFKLLAEPPSFGLSVTEEPGIGYRIRCLLIEHNRCTRVLGDIVHHSVVVTHDGRMGDRDILCVKGPEAEHSRPPLWVQPGPTSPEHYDRLLRPILTPGGSQVVPRPAVLTAQQATFPAAEGDPDPEHFVITPDRWPDHAKE